MLSQVVSVTRLRLYEKECRRQAAVEPDTKIRGELSEFADALKRAIRELETMLDAFEHYSGSTDARWANNPNRPTPNGQLAQRAQTTKASST
jgi:hypothetical protein